MHSRSAVIVSILLCLVIVFFGLMSYFYSPFLSIPLSNQSSFEVILMYGHMRIGTQSGFLNTGSFAFEYLDLAQLERATETLRMVDHPGANFLEGMPHFGWQSRSVNVTGHGSLQEAMLIFPIWVLLVLPGCLLGWQWFRRRFRRESASCAACGYDLRGTIEAGRRECPECGSQVHSKARA